MALSHVDRVLAIFYCSGSGGVNSFVDLIVFKDKFFIVDPVSSEV